MMTMLWNVFARIVWFLSGVLFEGFLYYIFREVAIDYIPGFIYIFDIAFVIWIIADAIMSIVAGTTFGLIKWFMGKRF